MSNTQEGDNDTGGPPEDYQDNLHIEPVFEAFICPLTKKVMQDPVILESGQTFENTEIEKWLSECRESGRKIICPLSQRELSSTYLIPNIALRNTIDEWRQRNETARLNLARLALSPESSEHDILEALSYIQNICKQNRCHKHFVYRANVIPRIMESLRSNSSSIHCKSLETLRLVAEDDSENKEAVGAADNIRIVIKFLIHDRPQEKLEAISLLYELSKSESLSKKIGMVNGAILILIGIASSKSEDVLTVQKAEMTLTNLERCEINVLQMAENGRLQPLLRLLLEGSPETKLAMASYLGQLVLSNDLKVLVAKTAGSSLVNLMINGSKKEKSSAIMALNHISSYDSSAKLLLEVGILPPLVKDLLTFGNKELPMSLKETSANILANIVAYCADSTSIALEHENQTLVSEDVIHNLLHLISNTGPAIVCKLIEVLVGLTSKPAAVQQIVASIKSSGATINVVQFIETQQKDLRRASIKLLHNISPYMSQELSGFLCDPNGYLAKLIEIIAESNAISEEQLAAIGILAKLPDTDTRLTKRLLRDKAFDVIVSQLLRIRRGEIRGGRNVTPFLEGLATVLLKLVYCLEFGLVFARANNLGALFTDLLQTNGADNVQMVSAVALENLSQKSRRFMRTDSPSSCVSTPWSKKKPITTNFCAVHHGYCSMKENFCLVDGNTVEKLVSCLDHANTNVVESALAALCTLLDEGVDLQQAVYVLSYADGVKPIMQLLENNRTETIQQKAVWAAEKMLQTEDIVRSACDDPNIVRALKQAFQHGDSQTKQNAERALKYINQMPQFSMIFTKPK